MSKIPYRYRTPIPMVFWKNGDLDPSKKIYKNRLAFLTWAFSECHYDRFEFSCSREQAAIKSGMSVKEWRTQEDYFIQKEFLTKKSNSIHDRISSYQWNMDKLVEEKIIDIKERASQIQSEIIENKRDESLIEKERASQIEKGPAKGPVKGPADLREEIEKKGQPNGQSIGPVYINNININKKTTTPLPPKPAPVPRPEKKVVVASLYLCLEQNNQLTPKEKRSFMQYPEERVKLALEFVNRKKVKESYAGLAHWHCKQEEAISPPPRNLNKHQEIAIKYNEDLLSVGEKDLYLRNQKGIIEKNIIFVPTFSGPMSIVLNPQNSLISDLERDFQESRRYINYRASIKSG